MEITLTLSPVEADALALAFPDLAPEAALHALLAPTVAKTSEVRLQRLATLYRALSPADQLEANQVLVQWQTTKNPPPVDPPGPPVEVPTREPR